MRRKLLKAGFISAGELTQNAWHAQAYTRDIQMEAVER